MARSKKSRARRSRSRSLGEGLVRAFATASQMALLYPFCVDEWMWKELERREDARVEEDVRRSTASGR